MAEYLCVDIGGTSIKYALFDEAGKRIGNVYTAATIIYENTTNIVDTLEKIVQEMMGSNVLSGICICSAGVVDNNHGKIDYAGYTIPGYTGTDLKGSIETKFGIRCEVENDVNAACLGEYWLGSGANKTSVLCLAIGTGIGGAVMLDGKLWHGFSNTACEVGYMKLSTGRFQDIASTTALIAAVSKVKEMNPADLNGKKIMQWAKTGDLETMEVLKKWVANLTEGIANLIYAYNPSTIILGGGIMEERTFFQPLLTQALTKQLIDPLFDKASIEFAHLGNEAGMIGALYHFLNKKEA